MGPSVRESFDELRTLLELGVAIMAIGTVLGTVLVLSGANLGPTDAAVSQHDGVALQAPTLFLTNLAVIAGLVFGGLFIGLPTVLGLFQNGVLLGILAGTAFRDGELLQFLLLLLPHGIFEVPAFWLASCLGFKIPRDGIQFLRGCRKTPLTRRDVIQYGQIATLAVVLLIIAAVIESTLTAQLARTL